MEVDRVLKCFTQNLSRIHRKDDKNTTKQSNNVTRDMYLGDFKELK